MRIILTLLAYLCVTFSFGYGDVQLKHLKTLSPCNQEQKTTGVASLDGVLFVICEGSDSILTFDTKTFDPLTPIKVPDLKGAQDVVVHAQSKSIYVLQRVEGESKVWFTTVANGVVQPWKSFNMPAQSTPLIHTTHPDWDLPVKFVETLSYDPPMVSMRFVNGTVHHDLPYPWTGETMLYLNVIAIPNLGLYGAVQTERGWYFQLFRKDYSFVQLEDAEDTTCKDMAFHMQPIEDFGYDTKKKLVIVSQPESQRLVALRASTPADATSPPLLACTAVSGFPSVSAKRLSLDDEERRLYVVEDFKKVDAYEILD